MLYRYYFSTSESANFFSQLLINTYNFSDFSLEHDYIEISENCPEFIKMIIENYTKCCKKNN